jgi:hypothetical protein
VRNTSLLFHSSSILLRRKLVNPLHGARFKLYILNCFRLWALSSFVRLRNYVIISTQSNYLETAKATYDFLARRQVPK